MNETALSILSLSIWFGLLLVVLYPIVTWRDKNRGRRGR